MFKIPENNWGFVDCSIIEELNSIFDKIGVFFPYEEDVLRFLKVDFDNLKYVVVGMEPYPTAVEKDGKTIPEATGRSFEVNSLRDKTWDAKFKQSSLRNILKAVYAAYTGEYADLETVREQIRNGIFPMKQPGEWFDSMESQGVLFLNASLTVEPYNVGSHTDLWQTFMDKLIHHIAINKRDVIWLLWGNDARQRVLSNGSNGVNYICSCHPRLADFVKDNCFMDTKVRRVDWRGV